MVLETIKTTTDTVQQVAEKSSDTGWIMHHIEDAHYLDFEPFFSIPLPHLTVFGIDVSITRHVIFMMLAAIILILIFRKVANSYKDNRVPKGLSNFMETMIVFVRDDVVKPAIGKGYEKFMPFLLTIFFFILTCNFLGLIPFGATATSNISITAGLAILSFLVTQIGGIAKNGFFGYFKGLIPGGVPGWLLPLMMVVELLGLVTKPFALAVRLFANLTAGHVVILSLIGLIFILNTIYVSPVSVAFALFIYLLEILVALIQAYIFTMLSSLFIGMAVHQDH